MGYTERMKALYVRALTPEETQALETGLRSNSGFTVRRCQMLLSSAQGLKAQAIAEQLHCSDETVRTTIHAFHEEGLACLHEKSNRPHSARFSFSAEALARLPDIVAASPRAYGQQHSLWSLPRLAAVCHQQGLTERVVSYETMRDALQRAGINWKRARKRMQSSDAAYPIKKNIGTS
jgi:transposase